MYEANKFLFKLVPDVKNLYILWNIDLSSYCESFLRNLNIIEYKEVNIVHTCVYFVLLIGWDVDLVMSSSS